ncbi:MAG: hypothetical protein C4524_04300 [Candidatus Zixiibacteriota bacterium]|nr:MAG: hypothetical protein C4524_04300 [candidate division Zixibacteria bacterium]
MLYKRIFLGLMIALVACTTVDARDYRSVIEKYEPPQTDLYNIARYNRVHRKGNIWLNITNWGFFGNESIGSASAMEDPEYPGTWAPQCEYPGNSNTQYLFMGAIWLGALVQEGGFEFPRVSLGSEGWTGPGNNNYEFEPGEVGGLPREDHGILERSTIPNSYNRLGDFVYSPDAIAEQDYVAVYTDTLVDRMWTGTDIVDGPHFPLGIRMKQTSYSWSYNYAQEFILIDYEFENIASNFLKNLYVGLYVDADVGWEGEGTWHEDDICGFQQWYHYERKGADGTLIPDSLLINTAYIADNDGRPQTVNSGADFTCPSVTGVRVVRAPNPRLKTSFNWWISNGAANLDFGPSWQDDGSEGDWTATYGTANGDARKYFVLSNGEFDYDQVYVDDPDTLDDLAQIVIDPLTGEQIRHDWRIENLTYAPDLANGYDTRYLLSWGPLGIYDHTDPAGNRVYRLNPGEKFHMTIAYVAGANFHTPQNPQGDVSGNNPVDPTKFNFANLQYNAAWAARVYDNEMIDSNGDGWYGEDTGTDGLYALDIGDSVVYFGVYKGLYPGPDSDGTERNNKLDPGEDDWDGPEFVYDPRYGDLDIGWMRGNGMLDPGDGIPDFKGPPPPPIPELEYQPSEKYVTLRWKNNAEDPDYTDPFSGAQDFEGYRIYVSNTGLEYDYQLLAEFDKVDFAYYSMSDSLATYPDIKTNMPPDSLFTNGETYYRQPVGSNTGLLSILETDSTYVFNILDAHPLFPRYYSVTAFDYGDPKSGTEPLETARNANRVYVAPSGNPESKVQVVPNPYRAYLDYTQPYLQTGAGGGISWENHDDGTPEFFPQTDRRLEFINLPAECLIRIYTVAGDLVQIIPHSHQPITNTVGDRNLGWVSDYSESWDLNSRNGQQVVSGIYLFSVEDLTPGNKGNIEVGKFVIIR